MADWPPEFISFPSLNPIGEIAERRGENEGGRYYFVKSTEQTRRDLDGSWEVEKRKDDE